jgi:hydrogenase nickel incorporation protein HypA/HybF
VAEGAELAIRHVDLRLRCGSCGHEYASEHVIARCPMCGSGERSILAGREMRVVSFEAC